ncbi:hypothetical protein C8R45DRAFT_997846 [Mycena sanguinolenta]|nr:hypothetical protein C8R45DRAFT_997846 [Mycena sanguinolenta]
MAAVAPQGPIPGAQTPQQDLAGPSQLSWEGDKMFNIYIYDYCHKRGFRSTARELLREAEIAPDSTPPINARQGLLFEWWSVFWVLFTAKANGNGTDDAMVYTHHQAAQAALKQNRAPAPQPMPLPGSGLMPGQPPIGRPGVNGVGPQRFPNGVLPNGIPQNNGQPPGPTAFNAAPGMQPNGIMPGQPGMGQFMGQPRPPLPGQPQRPPNGGAPFQSPTMAHSPPNTGQQPGHPPPPMGQLGPPRGVMLPPGQQMNPVQTPYQGLAGRPPSRTSTPQSGMMNPSPSMAPRQPIVPGNDPRQQPDMAALSHELQTMPPTVLNSLKMELGLSDKNINTLTPQDKMRIIQTHRQRMQKTGPPGSQNAAAGPSIQASLHQRRNNKRNSTSPGEDQTQPDDRNGSSPPDRKRPRRSPMEPPLHGAPMNNYGQHANQPPQPQSGGPGGPGGPPQGMGNGGMMVGGPRPMSGPMGGGFQPQGPPGMPGMQMGMLGMSPMMPGAGMQNSMSPQMHAQPTMMQYRQGLQHQQQGHPANRLSMSGPMNAGSPGADPSFNPNGVMQAGVGGPGGPGQQQFGGGAGNRLSGPQNLKGPMPMGMLPPPSPAKDQNKDTKPNGLVDGSPRNQPLANPNAPGTAPPTPNSSGQQQQQQQQQAGQQSQQNPGQQPPQQTTPGMIMNPNVNPGAMNTAAMALPPAQNAADNIFGNDFIQSVANGLDEFVDVGLFRGDGDLNFERDFGQWFNPDDVGMELGKQ